MIKHMAVLALVLAAGTSIAATDRPYAGQQNRDIKSRSAEDVQGYLSGKGMGLAKAAELNGYPGPAHVLALAKELSLSPKQVNQTRAVFQRMEAQAMALGTKLIEEERALNELFSSKTVTPRLLERSTKKIAQLHAQIRKAHLEAHVYQVGILGPEQIAKYQALRGYGAAAQASEHHHHQH